jgi:hypothetical protein
MDLTLHAQELRRAELEGRELARDSEPDSNHTSGEVVPRGKAQSQMAWIERAYAGPFPEEMKQEKAA